MDPKSKTSYLFVDRFNPKTSLWDGQNLYYQNQEQAKELAQNYGHYLGEVFLSNSSN